MSDDDMLPGWVTQLIESGNSGFLERLDRFRTSENEALRQLMAPSVMVSMEDNSGTLYLRILQDGLILTREEFDGFMSEMQEFYSVVTDEEIRAHNRNLLLRQFGPREKRESPLPKPLRKPV